MNSNSARPNSIGQKGSFLGKGVFVLALSVGAMAFAQKGNFGLNTTSPDATLDIQVTTTNLTNTSAQGIIIPNLGAARVSAMQNVKESTLVYVNDNVQGTGEGSEINGKGFYYYDVQGTTKKWKKIGTGASSGSALPTGTAQGQVIKWDTASSSWVLGTDNDTTGLPSSATNGQVLTWNGSAWVAQTPASGGGTDTSIYKGSGTLSGATTVTQNANNLTFSSTDEGRTIIDGKFETKGMVYATTRPVTGDLTSSVWDQDGSKDYIILARSNANPINLPDATKNKGRVVGIVNDTSGAMNWGGTDDKFKSNGAAPGSRRGGFYVSDGVTWYKLSY